MSIDSEFPPWPQWDSNKHAGDPVYGWANSGHLGGLGVVEDKSNNTLSFILDRGEPGQSGSLMYSTATHTPVGVFFGVRATRANMVTPRGQIVRAPLLFVPHPPIPPTRSLRPPGARAGGSWVCGESYIRFTHWQY